MFLHKVSVRIWHKSDVRSMRNAQLQYVASVLASQFLCIMFSAQGTLFERVGELNSIAAYVSHSRVILVFVQYHKQRNIMFDRVCLLVPAVSRASTRTMSFTDLLLPCFHLPCGPLAHVTVCDLLEVPTLLSTLSTSH